MLGKILKRVEVQMWMRKGFSRDNVYGLLGELYTDLKAGYDPQIIKFAKKHGFLASTVIALGINEKNYVDYLSDYDYWRMYPLDGRYHSWINNKLSLKYLLGDLGKYMPEYYFQITQDMGVFKLLDCPSGYSNDLDGIMSLIFDVKKVGLKDIDGFYGRGFYKAEVIGKDIFVNDKKYSREEFEEFILKLDNYIVMEYLESAGVSASIYPKTANSIRYIVAIEKGKRYKIGSFIKFGNKKSGYVDNLSEGGITAPIDKNGHFEFGYCKIDGVMTKIENHPDTGRRLEGIINEWDEIEHVAQIIMSRLPQLTYLGFDFVVSTKGVRLLEINDRSGLLTIQKNTPLLKDKEDNFYINRLKKIK